MSESELFSSIPVSPGLLRLGLAATICLCISAGSGPPPAQHQPSHLLPAEVWALGQLVTPEPQEPLVDRVPSTQKTMQPLVDSL